MNIAYYRKSKFNFEETLSSVISHVKEFGLEILGQTNLESELGTLLTVLDKDTVQKILKADHNLVGLIPASIAILKKGSDILVGTVNPELLAGVTPNHDIQNLSAKLSIKMKKLIDDSTGAGKRKVENVKLYSTHTCPYCKNEKDWLEKNMVKHETVYLEESPKEAEHVVRATGQMGVPVTEIIYGDGDSDFVIGFDKNKLEAALVN